MKLTLIKEEIQDKHIVDEVMETHLYEDEQEKKAKEEEGNEVVNDEVVNDEQPESDAVQDILDPEETTGFDIPDEPLPLEGETETTEVETNTDNGFPIEGSEPELPIESDNNDEVQGMENVNTLNGLISNLWGIIDQLKWIKNNNRMIKDEKNIESFNKIVESIIDDTTINVGMIYKLIQIVNPEVSMLVDKGKNKAEETILNR